MSSRFLLLRGLRIRRDGAIKNTVDRALDLAHVRQVDCDTHSREITVTFTDGSTTRYASIAAQTIRCAVFGDGAEIPPCHRVTLDVTLTDIPSPSAAAAAAQNMGPATPKS